MPCGSKGGRKIGKGGGWKKNKILILKALRYKKRGN